MYHFYVEILHIYFRYIINIIYKINYIEIIYKLYTSYIKCLPIYLL